MIIYLAGGISGNLNGYWKRIMNVYLASLSNEKNRLDEIINYFLFKKKKGVRNDEVLNIFLAGNDGYRKDRFKIKTHDLNILESFYYLKTQEWMFPLIKEFKNFLLDSGAFTFMNQNRNHDIDWDAYIEEYADFINKLDISLFFELDIDSIVGIDEVERLRHKLEKLTGKKAIPVWHVSRGHDYWLKMIKEYDYVAIGGDKKY